MKLPIQKGAGLMKLTTNEQIRVDVIIKYLNGDIYLDDALRIVNLCERHFRRILRSFRIYGFESIRHGNTNKPPKNKIPDKTRYEIIRLFRLKYFDLNISHFREKLLEDPFFMEEHVAPSYQTMRRILISENLIRHNIQRKKKAYRPRKRYEKEGLMVQIDGSHHHWILGHLPICLTAAIDDATGKVLAGKFTPTETTFAAMDVVKEIVLKKGRFQMLYSDKAGIYGGGKRIGYTNMDRAMKELGIIPIQASTPQAKGRVERLFKTLQDRLVSEMRLRGIQSIDEANKFFSDEYIDSFNKKFATEVSENCYQKLDQSIDLKEAFTMREQRIVANGNFFSYEGKRYELKTDVCYAKKTVDLRFYPEGEMKAFIMGIEMELEDQYQGIKNAA
jgi:hypothetical protein